ncbi:hypothetical protein Tco_1568985 [Tanacetum coccineum]
MKDLVANKELTKDDGEVRMNPRSSALLQYLLPPKENDPGSFILPCSIGRLDFNNALAGLGASISIMPFSMFKCLGIGKPNQSIWLLKWQMTLNASQKGLSKICEINHLLSIDPDVFTYDIEVQESYEEIVYKCSLIAQETNGDLEFEDPDGCGENKENEILGTILNKLHDEWFKGADEDDDNLEGIIDYLKPTLYDGFVDSDDEEYKERKCILLGMPYIKPPTILIEKVNVTRYSIGPGEVYTKIKISGVEELYRTRGNIATIRAGIMDEISRNDDNEESNDET